MEVMMASRAPCSASAVANLMKKTGSGNYPEEPSFMEAALKRLIDNGCVDACASVNGMSLFQIGLRCGSPPNVLSALLDRGCSVGIYALIDALTGLKSAIKTKDKRREYDSMGMICMLLEHDAIDVHTIGLDGGSAFDIAYEIGDLEVFAKIWDYENDMHDHISGMMLGELRQREVGSIMPPRLEFIVGVALVTKCAVPNMLNKILRHAEQLKKGEMLCVAMVDQGALENGVVDPNRNDSPLWHSARLGANHLCKSLIEHGENVNITTVFNETALHFAARNEHIETCTVLLEMKADPSITGSRGLPSMAPLHEAAMEVNPALLNVFIQHPAVDPAKTAYWNRTALHLVALAAHPAIICENTRPLDDYLTCIQMLVAAGVPVDAQDINGETALSFAVKNNCAAAVQLLLQNGADSRLRNTHNETAGSLCMQPMHQELLSLVVENAPQKDKGPLAWLLRDHAPYGNRTHGLGGAFHDEALAIWASSYVFFMHTICGWGSIRSSELIQVLLQCNPEVARIVDSAGRTPLDVAMYLGNEVAIRAIVSTQPVSREFVESALQDGLPGVRTLLQLGFGDHLAAQRDIVITNPPSSSVPDVIVWCRDSGVKYVDPSFPPCLHTLAGSELAVHSQYRDVYWVRASELCQGPLLAQGAVKCGALGDPFFIAAMPECDSSIFPEFDLARAKACGVYDVNVLWHGEHQVVTIDDFIPVLDGQCAFCISPDSSMWAMLYFKACAKLAGSFEALCVARRPLVKGGVEMTNRPADDWQFRSESWQVSDPSIHIVRHALLQEFSTAVFSVADHIGPSVGAANVAEVLADPLPAPMAAFKADSDNLLTWPRYKSFAVHEPTFMCHCEHDTALRLEWSVKRTTGFISNVDPDEVEIAVCVCEASDMKWQLIDASIHRSASSGVLETFLPQSETAYSIVFATFPSLHASISVEISSDAEINMTKITGFSGVDIVQDKFSPDADLTLRIKDPKSVAKLLTGGDAMPGALFEMVMEYCDTSDPARRKMLGMKAQVLLERDVDVNYVRDGKTVFSLAFDFANIEILVLLADQKPELLGCSGEEESPLLLEFEKEMQRQHLSEDRMTFVTQVAALLSRNAENNVKVLPRVLEHAAGSEQWTSVCINLIRGAGLQGQPSVTEEGLSVLHLASQKGASQVVNWLIAEGTPVDQTTACNETALAFACRAGCSEVAELLLSRNADAAVGGCGVLRGVGPLHEAAITASRECIELLLGQENNQVNCTAYWDRTPLHFVCLAAGSTGRDIQMTRSILDCSSLLIQGGAVIDKQDLDGETPLSYAVQSGCPELVEQLLANGADPTVRSIHNESAVTLAAASPQVLAKMKKLNPDSLQGEKVLTTAAVTGTMAQLDETACCAGEVCCVLGEISIARRVPLSWYAIYGGQIELALQLLTASPEHLRVDVDGSTILHKMCRWSTDRSLWDSVCKHIATTNQAGIRQDNAGLTPLELARSLHNKSAVLAILEHGLEGDADGQAGASFNWPDGAQCSSVEEARQWCEDSGVKYVDPSFPPCLHTLAGSELAVHSQYRDVYWVRASELCQGPLLAQGAVKCGALGDPFFIAAMPECDSSIFPEFDLARAKACGVYDVNVLWHGEHQVVTIDDFIPVLDGQCAFCISPDSSMWAMLYFKACAKLAGSFEALKFKNQFLADPTHADDAREQLVDQMLACQNFAGTVGIANQHTALADTSPTERVLSKETTPMTQERFSIHKMLEIRVGTMQTSVCLQAIVTPSEAPDGSAIDSNHVMLICTSNHQSQEVVAQMQWRADQGAAILEAVLPAGELSSYIVYVGTASNGIIDPPHIAVAIQSDAEIQVEDVGDVAIQSNAEIQVADVGDVAVQAEVEVDAEMEVDAEVKAEVEVE